MGYFNDVEKYFIYADRNKRAVSQCNSSSFELHSN